MLMRPINDVEGNALRDSDDNDDDEVRIIYSIERI
jgi:hypothetical protein